MLNENVPQKAFIGDAKSIQVHRDNSSIVAAMDREERFQSFSCRYLETVWKPGVVNGDQNQVMRLGTKHLYLLCHLTGSTVPHYLFKSLSLGMGNPSPK